MQLFYSTLLLLLYSGAAANARQSRAASLPTLAVRVTQDGVAFASRAARRILEKEMVGVQLPDIDIRFDVIGVQGKIHLSKLIVEKWQFPPNLTTTFRPPTQVQIDSSGGLLQLRGRWTLSATFIVPIRASGEFRAAADEGADLDLVLSTALSSEFRPHLSLDSCHLKIDELRLEFSGDGSLSWLLNALHGLVATEVKSILNKKACSILDEQGVQQLNQLVDSFPKNISIAKTGLVVDWSVPTAPLVTRSFVHAESAVDVVYGKDVRCRLPPSPFQYQVDRLDKALYVWLSEQVVDCLLETAHSGGLLRTSLSKDIPVLKPYLATKCQNWLTPCVGRFFPDLAKRFPDQYVDVIVSSAAPPHLHLNRTLGSLLNTTLFMDLFLAPISAGSPRLARLEVTWFASIVPLLENGRISANITMSNADFTVVSSAIGKPSTWRMVAARALLRELLDHLVGAVLRYGVQLPEVQGISVSHDSRLNVEDNAIMLAADFVAA